MSNSNNIYNILNTMNKLTESAQPAAPVAKKNTLLESTMEQVLASKFAESKTSPAYQDAMAAQRAAGTDFRIDNARARMAQRAAEPKTIGQKIKKDIGEPLAKLAKGDVRGALGEEHSMEEGVDHTALAANLGKLARVIKSVQTPEQFKVAREYARRMSGTIMKHQHDNSGFGSGLRANLGVMRDIHADLKAKAVELGIEFDPLAEGWDDMVKTGKEAAKEITKGEKSKFDKKEVSTGTVYTRKSDKHGVSKDDEEDKSQGRPVKDKFAKKKTDESLSIVDRMIAEMYEEDQQAQQQLAPQMPAEPESLSYDQQQLVDKIGQQGYDDLKQQLNNSPSAIPADYLDDVIAVFGQEVDAEKLKEVCGLVEPSDTTGLQESAVKNFAVKATNVLKQGAKAGFKALVGKDDKELLQQVKDKDAKGQTMEHAEFSNLLKLAGIKEAKAKRDFDNDGRIESEKDEVQDSHRKAAGLPFKESAADEKADDDYDNDGKVETGKEEYLGSKIAAAKKAGKLKEGETCPSCKKDPCVCEETCNECGMLESKCDCAVNEAALNQMRKIAGLQECMSPMGSDAAAMQAEQGKITVTTNSSTDGTKTVNITADGEGADQLMQMLKLAGMAAQGGEQAAPEQEIVGEPEGEIIVVGGGEGEQEVDENAADKFQASTTPQQHIEPVEKLTKGGNGEVAGAEKAMHKHGYRQADNPLAMHESAKLMREYESIKVKK